MQLCCLNNEFFFPRFEWFQRKLSRCKNSIWFVSIEKKNSNHDFHQMPNTNIFSNQIYYNSIFPSAVFADEKLSSQIDKLFTRVTLISVGCGTVLAIWQPVVFSFNICFSTINQTLCIMAERLATDANALQNWNEQIINILFDLFERRRLLWFVFLFCLLRINSTNKLE